MEVAYLLEFQELRFASRKDPCHLALCGGHLQLGDQPLEIVSWYWDGSSMSVYISLLALSISVLAYVFPRTAGGAVKWDLVAGDATRPPDLVHVGHKKALKVRVLVHDGIGGESGFTREAWYPNDSVHVLNAIRTMGNPAPRVEVTWKIFGVITKRVVLTG
jgi:hypothetical protein